MKTSVVCAVILSAVLALSARGADVYWLGGSNTWQTASAWSGGAVPSSGDAVVITNGIVEYVPGGDLTIGVTGSLTVGKDGRFFQNGGVSWMQIQGKILIDGGEFDTGTAGQMNLSGSFVVSNGTFRNRGTMNATGAFEVDGGTVVYSSGNLVLGSALTINGGTFTVPGELQFSDARTLAGGTVVCSLVAAQASAGVLILAGGSIYATSSGNNGIWQSGSSYLDFSAGTKSTATFTGVTSDAVYSTYFSGTSPKIRYGGETVSSFDDFTNRFEVLEDSVASGTVTIRLKQAAGGALAFADGCTVSSVGESSAMLAATVSVAGDPAATVYALWGTNDCGASFSGWQHVAALGEATNGATYSVSAAATPETLCFYRFALSNSTAAAVFAVPSPKVFMAGANVNAFTGATSADAATAANWSKGTVPSSAETVVFSPYFAAQEMTWSAAAPKTVGKWLQPGPFPGGKADWCVTFETTTNAALSVAGSVTLAAGRWTHAGPSATPSNAVNVVIGGDLLVGSAAEINAGNGIANDTHGKARGYYLAGPGFLDGTGASYGGEGTTNAATYGSILNPLDYGSSGHGDNSNFAGGGLIILRVAGTATVDGAILANGFGWPETGSGAGSGGTVNLTAASLRGVGKIAANGGEDTLRGSGSGGRIRVKLTDAAAAFGSFTGTITAYGKAGNVASNLPPSSAGTVLLQLAADTAASGMVVIDNPELTGTDVGPVRAAVLPAADADGASLAGTVWNVRNHGALRVAADTHVAGMELGAYAKLVLNGRTLHADRAAIGDLVLVPGTYTVKDYDGILVGNGKLVVGIPVVADGADVYVDYGWVTNHCAAAAGEGAAAISNALVTAGVNGLPRWQSYMLGLEPDKADCVVLCDAKQTAAADCVTFCAKNVAPASNGACRVEYVLECSQNGRDWVVVGASPSNAVSVTLPTPASLFRLRTDIIIQ